MREESRYRISLVDVLVVVVVMLLLAGLLLPGTVQPRENARQAMCNNNSKALTLAIINGMLTRGGNFPGYLQAQKVDPSTAWQDEFPQTPEKDISVAWPGRVLPYVDQQTLFEQMLTGQFLKNGRVESLSVVTLFICPTDPPEDTKYPALSYVVNSGMPDLPNPTQATPSDLAANGVCHDLRPDRWGPKVGSSAYKDGGAFTILLSENIQRDYPTRAAAGNTWWQPALANPEQWYGMTWVYDANDPKHPSTSVFEPIARDSRTGADLKRPYRDFGSRFARPASNHPDVFVAAFCDGHTRDFSNSIDYRVYQQLMTPNGQKIADASNPSVLLEQQLQSSGGGFMIPPLQDSDY